MNTPEKIKKNIFFAANFYEAQKRLKKIADNDFYKEYYKGKHIELNNIQIKHIKNWLTFKVI